MLANQDGTHVPHPSDDEELEYKGVRIVSVVARQIKELVPDEYKDRFEKIADSCDYAAPELQRPYWGVLGDAVTAIMPPFPEKLNQEWQIKAVAVLSNQSEEVVRKNFSCI